MTQGTRRGARALVLIIAMLSTLVGRPAFAHTDPAACDGTGVSITLRAFRSDGSTIITGSDTVEDDETIVFRSTLAKPSDACAFSGGSLTIDPPGPVGPQDVTPSGGIPCIGGTSPGCVPSITSQPLPYVVTHSHEGAVPARSVVAITNYGGGVVHDRPDDGTGPTASTTKAITVAHPDLVLVKTPDGAIINSGDTASFTLNVTNVGAASAKNVTISDTIPNFSGTLTWTESPDLAACSMSGNTLSCAIGNLAPSASFAVTVSAVTPPDASGTLTNTACTQTTSNELVGTTPSTDNNCDVGDITVRAPGLAVTKTADASPVNTTDTIGYTIGVSNNGPGIAYAATLSDPLPAGPGIDWSISPVYSGPGTCSIAGVPPTETLSCAFGNMGVGASASLHIRSGTTSASAGTYNNTATASATNTASRNASAQIIVLAPALTITKTEDASPVSTTQNIGYTITVGNTGPGTAYNATLNDPLPAGSGVDWSISPAYTGPGTCQITGTPPSETLSCTFGHMATGATASLHISSGTTSASSGTYYNVANYAASNHVAVNDDATIIVRPAALSIQKTADASPVSVGDGIGYAISVTNLGPGTAFSATLADPLPAGSGIDWSISPAYAGPGTCSIAGSPPAEVLNCSFGNLTAGQSVSLHIASSTNGSSAGTYVNNATATAANTASVADDATIVVRPAPLTITKVADPNPVSTTEGIGFTITVGNTGPGTARSVTLQDSLPTRAGIAWSITPAYAGPGSCAISAGTLTCSFGDMVSGASASVHIASGTTSASAGTYTNTATAAALYSTPVQATASTIVHAPFLTITKAANAAVISTTENMAFTVRVRNTGLGKAFGTTISDPLPSGAGVNWSISSVSGPGTCAITGPTGSQSLDCALGTFLPGGTLTVIIGSGTTVDSVGNYPNTATTQALNNGAVDASDTIQVVAPQLAIVKTANAASIFAGQEMGFTITVTNAGPGKSLNTTLTDPLPGHASFNWSVRSATSGAVCSISGTSPVQALSCDLGTMTAGQSVTVVVVTATAGPCKGLYENTATADALNHDAISDDATVEVLECCLVISAAADSAEATEGNTIGFTFTLRNNGPASAQNATLSADLPTDGGMTWTISPSSAECSISPAQKLSCSYGTLTVGPIKSVHVIATTTGANLGTHSATAAGRGRNVATVFATASTVVKGAPVPFIGNAACTPTVAPGGTVTFSTLAGNSGTESATGATLTATIPANATLESAPGASQTGDTLTWTLGTLGAGDIETRTFVVRVDAEHGDTVETTLTLATNEKAPVLRTIAATVSAADAETDGAAHALTIRAVDEVFVDQANSVTSSASGPNGAQRNDAGVGLPGNGTVDAALAITSSDSAVTGGTARTTALAELTGVSILEGTITADVLRAQANANAGAEGLTADAEGSTIEGLAINGVPVSTADRGTTIEIRNPLDAGQVIARVETLVSERSGDRITVTALRITVLQPVAGLAAGAVISVSSATAGASFPGDAVCTTPLGDGGTSEAAAGAPTLGILPNRRV